MFSKKIMNLFMIFMFYHIVMVYYVFIALLRTSVKLEYDIVRSFDFFMHSSTNRMFTI
jgi:hypothetical protein